MHVGYYTECVDAYIKAVDGARNWEELIEAIGPFKLVAKDAIDCALKEAEGGDGAWLDFSCGLKKERHKHFAGEEWATRFMPILMPEVMFQVSAISEHYGAPWGCAYIQSKNAGLLVERKGIAHWKKRHEQPD